jgi:hypothetical protein
MRGSMRIECLDHRIKRLPFTLARRLQLLVFTAICGLVVMAATTVHAVSLTLIPPNPKPGDLVYLRMVEVPPGCPAEPRAGTDGRFGFDLVMTVDFGTPPGFPLGCDFTAILGRLVEGVYSVRYNNRLTFQVEGFSFNVIPGGGGWLSPQAVPALGFWSLLAIVLAIPIIAAVVRRPLRPGRSKCG